MFARASLVTFVLLVPCGAGAENMVRIPDSKAHCSEADRKNGAYCYEWSLTQDPSVRIVSVWFEDGGTFTIYTRSAEGAYAAVAEVLPALRDRDWPGEVLWGYSWDIRDIAAAADPDGIKLFVALNYSFIDDSDRRARKPKNPRPMVLFLGKSQQPDIKISGPRDKRVRFKKMSVEELRVYEHG